MVYNQLLTRTSVQCKKIHAPMQTAQSMGGMPTKKQEPGDSFPRPGKISQNYQCQANLPTKHHCLPPRGKATLSYSLYIPVHYLP